MLVCLLGHRVLVNQVQHTPRDDLVYFPSKYILVSHRVLQDKRLGAISLSFAKNSEKNYVETEHMGLKRVFRRKLVLQIVDRLKHCQGQNCC